MKQRDQMMTIVLVGWLAATGCSKTADTSQTAATTPPAATPIHAAQRVSSSPAVGIGTTAATNAPVTAQPGVADTHAVASTRNGENTPVPATGPAPGPAPSPTPVAVDAETLRKQAQIEWALKQDEIKNDPDGQWAVRATASSAFHDAKNNSPYSPAQATGAPNIEGHGHSGSAWAPKTPDAGIEWLVLEYPKSVYATMVRVRESYGSGAVMKIELIDEKGAPHTVWSGADPTNNLDYLVAEFPKTAFKTARVKVTLATNVVGGANQIDAVQLVGTDK